MTSKNLEMLAKEYSSIHFSLDANEVRAVSFCSEIINANQPMVCNMFFHCGTFNDVDALWKSHVESYLQYLKLKTTNVEMYRIMLHVPTCIDIRNAIQKVLPFLENNVKARIPPYTKVVLIEETLI